MARRPDFGDREEVLSREQVDDLRRSLSLLSPSHVLDFCRETHKQCAPERRPTARAMQQVVTAGRFCVAGSGIDLE
jgi:hypothetical protein